jgi:hypothetical protein
MSWGTIAQAIFFLAIALLATVITIFVFASSLLGRAVQVQANAQAELRAVRKNKLKEQLETAQELVNKLKEQCGAGDFKVDDAMKSLQEAKERNREFDKESNSLQQKYKVFTVRGGVTYPTCFFLSVMVLSALAWALGATGTESFNIGGWEFYTVPCLYVLVPMSLLLIGFGIHRLYSSLQRIREVAITAEELTMRRDIEAFKTAHRELEAEEAPKLKIECVEPDSLPIRMQAGDETSVGFALTLISGQMAEDISFFIFVPPGFDFPDLASIDKHVSRPKSVFPGYLYTLREYSRLIKGIKQNTYFTIKAPSNIGVFKIKYGVNCRGLERLSGEIDVEVMPKSESVEPKISKPKG